MTESQVYKDKITACESFINETLKEDLKNLINERDKVNATIGEYLQLKNMIQGIQDAKMTEKPLKTKMDLGCYVLKSSICTKNYYKELSKQLVLIGYRPDPSRIRVQIGLDVYVEFTLDEASRFIDKKVAYLKTIITLMTKRSASIKAHIKMMLEGLRELQHLERVSEEKPRRDL